MLKLFSLCCKTTTSNDSTTEQILHPLSYSQRHLSVSEYFHEMLNNKLGFIVIYKHESLLTPFIELKKNKDIKNILNNYYYECYRHYNEQLSIDLLEKLSLEEKFNNLLVIFLFMRKEIELDSSCVMEKIIDEKVNVDILKKAIITNQFRGLRISTEPGADDLKSVSVQFRCFNGKSIYRKFKYTSIVNDLYNYVRVNSIDLFGIDKVDTKFCLAMLYPYKKLCDKNNGIIMEGITNNACIQIEEEINNDMRESNV